MSADILLATYNGEKYLEEQLKSLEEQTYKDWILHIEDDGSKDNTLNIINRFKKKYPNKVKIYTDSKKKLGPARRFLSLLKKSKSEYVLFCDQDDVWINNKIEIEIKKISEEEQINKQPILIFTDLVVVDENLNIISESFWKLKKLKKTNSLGKIINENIVTGCTICMNSLLRNEINSIASSKDIVMHDSYIYIYASLIGKVLSIDEKTVYYRQHSSNEVGVQRINFKYLKRYFFTGQINKNLYLNQKQIENILYNLKNRINSKDVIVLEEFIKLYQKDFFKSKINMLKYSFYKSTILKTLAFILFTKKFRKD